MKNNNFEQTLYYVLLIINFFLFKLFKKQFFLSKFKIIFVRLHCLSNGRSTFFLSKLILKFSIDKNILNFFGSEVLKNLSSYEINDFIYRIDSKSYAIYPHKLSENIVNLLYNFSLDNFTKELSNNQSQTNQIIKYHQKNENSEKLTFFQDDLIKNKDIQELICDQTIIKICREYFNNSPILAEVNMWWSIANKNGPSSEAAQLYHFDLDATKWLKIFIYLTDVDLLTGPHCYVEGTHKNNETSRSLLSRGYQRIPDEDIIHAYSKDRLKTIIGKKGTIIFGDTKAFHKGLKPVKNDRLVLELTYINSNFLYEGNRIKLSILDLKNTNLKNNIKKNNIYQNILLVNS